MKKLTPQLCKREMFLPVRSRKLAATGNASRRFLCITNLPITTDHGGKTCRIFSVTDDALTCAKGGAVLQRANIRHIKLTHYLRFGLVGFAAGGSIGAAAGGIAGKPKPCPTTGVGVCLNGLGYGAAVLVVGVGSAVVGGVVGAATDLARGSSIYTRP